MDFIKYILDNDYGSVETESNFKELTTIGCGGKIKYLYSPNSIYSLCKVYAFLNKNEYRYFVIGNGSNTLASDDFFDGVVINLRNMKASYEVNGNVVTCDAFYPSIKFAYQMANLKLGDISFLGGIPGLIGGAIYNNSGAFGDSIANHLLEVTYMNQNGIIETIEAKDCDFGYRKSVFQTLQCIIISCKFKLENICTKELLKKRLLKRKESQPLESKNCGSIFKNSPLISSWKVVDALHMRGFQINDAAVSSKHSNFIINMGNAKTKDILDLIQLIKNKAFIEFGILLNEEITIV